ncbi:ABC transporter permease [Shumkonia mesophila]|uniref:ABC transporter permease n=1 Tax=Shumkonia mesophila TaxID=2838854 RepID=UPI0029349B1C|nr:FtsX-like permease family protein [Shumkonia mesophila]
MAVAEKPARRGRRGSMFATLLIKALLRRGGRAGVAAASIVVGAAVVAALMSLYLDISIKMSEELRAFGANFYVGPAAAGGERGIAEDTYGAVLGEIPKDRLVGASPLLYGIVRLDLGPAVIAGVDFRGLRQISPYWQVEGSWVGVAFDERNCMIGRQLAESMELKVGDTVTVINRERDMQTRLTVKGIVDTGAAEDEQMFVNLGLAQKLLDLPGRVDFAMLSLIAQGPEADAMAARINAAVLGVEAKPIRKISQSDGQILDKIEGLMALVALTILVITTLCVNATLSAMVAERTPEIGLQKALGAENRAIVAQFLAETALICVAAVAVGLILGFGLAQVLGQAVFNAWVTFRPAVVPLTLIVSLAAALVAAILPVRGAIGVVPARVLKGE